MTDEQIIAAAIRDACPDPDDDCLPDEEACFEKHPVHGCGTTNGVIDEVYADVDKLAALIVAALNVAGRLGPGSTSPEPGPEPLAEAPTLTQIVEFLDPDGVLRAEPTKGGTE